MLTVTLSEAKRRFSALIKAVEEDGEVVVICRNGKEVAEIRRRSQPAAFKRGLTPDPRLAVQLAPGYDPAEPLTDDEWPEECR